ncbi:MAG: hypothetical protein JOY71_06885 [Acetobacteraceae bacterium]|nr:hypothetical protein [Acetobacteraceae bacterium]
MSEARVTQPHTWNLTGAGGVQVRFSVAEPQLQYQDVNGTRNFSGNDIRLSEVPDLGTVVTVTLQITVDSGSTSFSLLLPRVNLPGPPATPLAVPVVTEGITTVHHLSLVPAFQHGQQDTYMVTQLRGTAA